MSKKRPPRGRNKKIRQPKFQDQASAPNVVPFVDHSQAVPKSYQKPTEYETDYVPFFKKMLPGVHRDLFSSTLMFQTEGEWEAAESNIRWLRGHARIHNLKANSVEDYLATFAKDQEKRLRLNLPKWDGRDRLREIAQCIHAPEFSHDEIEAIFKQWGTTMFKRVYEPERYQNRCLIFRGGQGIGKDTLINAMTRALGDYKRPYSSNADEREQSTQVANSMCIHISEFSRTKRGALATLKNHITGDVVEYREPYARKAITRKMRASWIASANMPDILSDSTGNRRFIVIDIEKIEYAYPLEESAQVLSQWLHYANQDKHLHLPPIIEAKIKAIIEDETPDDMEQETVKAYENEWDNRPKLQMKHRAPKGDLEVIDLIHTLSKKLGLRDKEFRSILNRNGYQQRTGSQRYFLRHPKPKGSSPPQ